MGIWQKFSISGDFLHPENVHEHQKHLLARVHLTTFSVFHDFVTTFLIPKCVFCDYHVLLCAYNIFFVSAVSAGVFAMYVTTGLTHALYILTLIGMDMNGFFHKVVREAALYWLPCLPGSEHHACVHPLVILLFPVEFRNLVYCIVA